MNDKTRAMRWRYAMGLFETIVLQYDIILSTGEQLDDLNNLYKKHVEYLVK